MSACPAHGKSNSLGRASTDVSTNNNDDYVLLPDSISPIETTADVVISVFLTVLLLPILIITFLFDKIVYVLFHALPFLRINNAIRAGIMCNTTLSQISFTRAIFEVLGLRDFLEFIITHKGDRRSHFEASMKQQKGKYFLLYSGFWASSHELVTEMLTKPQKRSVVLGTNSIATPKVFHPQALIFLSNQTREHNMGRNLAQALFKSDAVVHRIKNAGTILRPVLDDWFRGNDGKDFAMYKDSPEIVGLTVQCTFMIILGKHISKEAVQLAVQYEANKLFVLLPNFMHALAAGVLAKKTERLRMEFAKAIDLQNYDPLVEAATRIGLDITVAVQSTVDILLFAGVIGTSHIVGVVLDQMKKHVSMFHHDPASFIYECARIDPPVTSCTTIVDKPKSITWNGKDITLLPGTPLQATISTANSDPKVWSDDKDAFHINRDYSQLVSWNGLLGGEVGSRFCPGKDISFTIARVVAEVFAGRIDTDATCTIQIMTGTTRDAGSKTSQAYVRFHGTKGVIGEVKLPSSKYVTGRVETHVIPFSEDIGDIVGLSLWRKDKNGLDRSPNWYVNWITLEWAQNAGVTDAESQSSSLKYALFPVYSWVRNEPKTVFGGNAKVFQSLNATEKKVREQYLKEQSAEYGYAWRHDSLGDWKGVLPASVKLKEKVGEPGALPIDEVPLKEESNNFQRSLIDAVGNNVFQYIVNFCRKKPRTIVDYISQLRPPNIIYHENDERPNFMRVWRTDDAFARLMTSGLSPIDLKLISTIPLRFGVTDEMIPGSDATIQSELNGNRLYILDFDAIESMAGPHHVGDEIRYFTVPFALFHCDLNGRLMPVAIQIDREEGSLVFTPKDNPNDWLAARMFVSNCYFQVHQFRTHALTCHFAQETVAVGTFKMLPSSHPVYKLLRPHFDGLMSINNSARGSLVLSENVDSFARISGDVTAVGANGNLKSAMILNKDFSLEKFYFENRLKANGVSDSKILENYPFRDDGRLVMNAIENYVTRIVNLFYANDDVVVNDQDIQGWARDMVSNGQVHGLPGNGQIGSRNELCYILANIIFTASAFHAAVNFNQVAIAGNTANVPGALYSPPPTEKGLLREEDLVDMLPPRGRAQIQIGVLGILSTQSGDTLGYFRERLFVEPAALKVQTMFRKELAEVEDIIVKRNENRVEPYNSFRPSRIPNSTAI
mmetsp:Transcript_34/g.85  ORF Transcript_34/g.85 Transcript_34/m.85 type:complete len:1180 (+) Transcript_34:173-3712(+)|eukprot:CAMPEP_0195523514 /NCGR_PEP_ID=MMETSP0794_2-20130614/22778_1 /TAXON_ID=515487 /ORGANISM="Stephanopyxis turris, Strain CCMP 815" /LENGTH=1179 /DNA_ID=CAMNT_0040653531 /DNA_START=173 /DNA_END=3712 /DNA_ORIENTATION=+